MNGIFPTDLAVYLLLTPIVIYIFLCHRWTGFLPWYYLTVFCFARIIGGGLGIHDSNGLPANIIQSVGLTPLILAIDGLIHEAYVLHFPPSAGLKTDRILSGERIGIHHRAASSVYASSLVPQASWRLLWPSQLWVPWIYLRATQSLTV
jgi:hypothetical protein